MRPAEVCIVRPCDIDRSVDPWLYVPDSHKTEHHGRERMIFLGPQAQVILLRYLARDAEAYCFRPCDSEAKTAGGCPCVHGERRSVAATSLAATAAASRNTLAGDRYNVDAYRRAIHRACDAAFPPVVN